MNRKKKRRAPALSPGYKLRRSTALLSLAVYNPERTSLPLRIFLKALQLMMSVLSMSRRISL
jgi:hypothetical protein